MAPHPIGWGSMPQNLWAGCESPRDRARARALLHGPEDYRLARALAVNPPRQEARPPFGLRRLTAPHSQSKHGHHAHRRREKRPPSLEPDRGSSLRPALEARRADISLHNSQAKALQTASFHGPPPRIKSPSSLRDVYLFPTSSSVWETRNIPRISLSRSRTREIRPSGIIGGRRETSAMVGMCTRPAIERAGNGNPPPTAGSARFLSQSCAGCLLCLDAGVYGSI